MVYSEPFQFYITQLIINFSQGQTVQFKHVLFFLLLMRQQRQQITKLQQQQQQMKQYVDNPELCTLSWSRVLNIFFVNGITILVGWNAVLTSLDYFATVYPSYNVYLYFPIPIFAAYGLTAVTYHQIHKRAGHQVMIKCGVTGVNVFLALLLCISLWCKQQIQLGFYLSLLTCFCMGVSANLFELSLNQLFQFYGSRSLSRYTVGTAFSGLVLVCLRALITLIMGQVDPSSFTPILFYFIIAICINFFDLYLNIKLFAMESYKERVKLREQMALKQLQDNPNHQSYASIMWQALKVSLPYPLLIFLSFCITFMLFPNLALAKKMQFGTVWTSIYLIIAFNLGDLLGKLAGDFRSNFNSESIIYLVAVRFFFYFTFPLLVKQFTQGDNLFNHTFFPLLNIFMFGVTNGLVSCGGCVLSFEAAPLKYKKYTMIATNVLLELGIATGSFLAVPFSHFVNPDIQ